MGGEISDIARPPSATPLSDDTVTDGGTIGNGGVAANGGIGAHGGALGDSGTLACLPTADSLADIYTRYFAAQQPTGCTSGCHGTGSGGFGFRSAEELWRQTVGVAATSDPSKHRVEPGNPAASVLYQKLLAIAPSRMPSGGPYLDDAALAQVAGWICAGAAFSDAGVAPGGGTDGGVSMDSAVADAGQVVEGMLAITDITPSGGVQGTQVNITGVGFAPTPAQNEVRFNNTVALVRNATATSLDVVVPAGATSGLITVSAFGLTATSAFSFQVLVLNPTPTLTSVSPSTVEVSAGATLRVIGTGFVPGAVAKLDGVPLTTTVLSATELTASLAAASFSTPGTHQLTVMTPSPGGGTTSALMLVVDNPSPTLSTVSPTSVLLGAAAQSITVTGTGFVASSLVRLDGAQLTTTFGSNTQLTAAVSAATFAVVGTHQVTVTTQAPGGGTSTALAFSVANPVPTLTSISPATVPAGTAAFSLSLTGTSFVPSSVVSLDGAPVVTTFVNTTSLAAAMPAFSSTGTHTITVTSPTPGGGTSSSATLTVQTLSTPFISGLSPNPATANQAFILTVTGLNFVCSGLGPKVLWNGAMLTPSTCGGSQLAVAIPSTSASTATVSVQNANTATSNVVNLSVVAPNPVPSLSALSPTSTSAGTGALTLTVNGTGFAAGASLTFNGTGRPTTVVSSTQLTAAIPSGDVATAGAYPVVVTNAAPGGGASNTLSFSVVAPNPAPSIVSLSPSSAIGGASALTLTVTGAGFVASSQVAFNGLARTTTFVSPSSLTAAVLAADVAVAGTYPVVVTTPAPGGGVSNSSNFIVNAANPVPALGSLTPSTIATGSGATTVSVSGSGFISGSQATFNGSARTTTYVSATTISVALTSTDTATSGSFPIVVTNPAPGGGTSNTLNVSISNSNPVPAISSLSPCGVVAGTGPVSVGITGTGFVATSSVKFGSTTVAVTVNGATSITATVPATLIATAPAGNALSVIVTNPIPGGGASSSATFGVASATSTLSANVQPIFTASCASSACHAGTTPQAGLDLSSGRASANLLGVSSTGCTDKVLIMVCGPSRSQSVLIDKILATSSSPPCSGTAMPKGAPLSASEKQTIVDWVAQGAK